MTTTVHPHRVTVALAVVAAQQLDAADACDACHVRPAGQGHFARYCQPCADLPYGQAADVLADLPGPVLMAALPDARTYAYATQYGRHGRMSDREAFANVAATYPGGMATFLADVAVAHLDDPNGDDYPEACSWCPRAARHALDTLDRRCDLHDRTWFGTATAPQAVAAAEAHDAAAGVLVARIGA